jgi:hypothetical protein
LFQILNEARGAALQGIKPCPRRMKKSGAPSLTMKRRLGNPLSAAAADQ